MRLLDTNILIDVLREYPPAIAWLASTPVEEVEEIGLPCIVVMELIQGRNNLREVRQIERMVKPFPIYWPTEQDCRRALNSFARYNLRYNLGLADALIAECAVGLGVPLLTSNVRHFRAITALVPSSRTGGRDGDDHDADDRHGP